jgi:hypothetical protein
MAWNISGIDRTQPFYAGFLVLVLVIVIVIVLPSFDHEQEHEHDYERKPDDNRNAGLIFRPWIDSIS